MRQRLLLTIVFCTLLLCPTALAQDLEKRIEVFCDFPGQRIEAGDIASFDLLVINHGSTATYHLLSWGYRDGRNWDVAFMDGATEVDRIMIPGGGSKTVTFLVDTPGDADIGEYGFRIGIGDERVWVYTTITKSHRGEKGTLDLIVVDKEGDVVRGATVGVYAGATLVEQMMTTAEGRVSIEVPKGTYTCRIEKPGYKTREEKDVDVRIGRKTDLGIMPLEREMFYAEFQARSPSRITMVGSNPVFEIRMKNIGRSDDTYALSVSGLPEGWYARYKESASGVEEVSELFVPAGEEKTLYLEFLPPYGVEIGEYVVTAVAGSPARIYEETLTLRMRGSHDMRLSSRGYRYETTRGGTVSFEVTVANTGTAGALTNIVPEISAPEGWTANIDPESIASLDAGDRRTVAITVAPPGDIVAGEYKLGVKVTSDQLEREDEFRILIKERSFIALFGLLLLAAVFAGLWYVYRNYGRR